MYRTRMAAAGGALALAATLAASAPAAAAPTSPRGGNLACPAGTTAFKIDRAPVEGEVLTDGKLTVTITDVRLKADGSGEAYGFDYSASGATVVVTIVKGGPTASRFRVTEGLDTKLSPGGRHYGISNVTFCYR
jgi:hypothetical protein